jgi:transcriptional regulator with XRE-family HTH domain
VTAGEPELGALVRAARGRAGLTQEELAERAGLTAQSIGSIERGVTLSPRADVLERLLDALGLTPDEERALRAAARAAARRSQRPPAPVEMPADAGRGSGHDEPASGEPWRGGLAVVLEDRRYLIDGPVEEVRSAPDGSWAWRDAPARALDGQGTRVWLRRVATTRVPSDSGSWHGALATQRRLLAQLSASGRLGPAQDLHEVGRDTAGWRTTLVQGVPPEAATLRQAFGPSGQPLAGLEAALLLEAVVPLCADLAELHRLQFSHRLLSPDGVLVVAGGRRAHLRDLGLAGAPVAPDEGWRTYRAPEQRRPAGPGGQPGPATDVYQLAAVLFHVLTGHPPAPSAPPPPLAATNRELPSELDDVLRASLSPAPRDRPQTMDAVSSVLRWTAERTRRRTGP